MGRKWRSYDVYVWVHKHDKCMEGWLNAYKPKHRHVWVCVLWQNRHYQYLCTIPPKIIRSRNKVLEYLKNFGLYNIRYRHYKGYNPQLLLENISFKPLYNCKFYAHELIGDIWIKRSRGHPYLCLCQGFKFTFPIMKLNPLHYLDILATLKIYGANSDRLLKWLRGWLSLHDHQCLLSWNVPKTSDVETWGYEAIQEKMEDWGYETIQDEMETWGDDALVDLSDAELEEMVRNGEIDEETYERITGEELDEEDE